MRLEVRVRVPVRDGESDGGEEYGEHELVAGVADIYYVVGVGKHFVPASRVCADEAEDALTLLCEGRGNDEESACRSSKDGWGDELGATT